MNDCKKFIENLMDRGVSLDEIAAEFSNAMNEIEAVNNVEKQRNDYLIDLEDSFIDAYEKGSVGVEDIAGFATVVVFNDLHDEWTVEQCKEFNEYMKTCMTHGANLLSKSIKDIVEDVFSGFSIPEKIKFTSSNSDKKTIEDFIKRLGL